MSLVVVVGCETAQPARNSESAMRIALAAAARGKLETARNLPTRDRFQHPNWASEGARSSG
jgi:hypothetical protein